MKVQCSKCKSNYNIKDEKIPDAGAKIKCPKCQNMIDVKKPESELPEWVSEDLTDDFGNESHKTELKEERNLKTKTCPYCAEKILKAALKCKHCGSDLTEGIPTKVISEKPFVKIDIEEFIERIDKINKTPVEQLQVDNKALIKWADEFNLKRMSKHYDMLAGLWLAGIPWILTAIFGRKTLGNCLHYRDQIDLVDLYRAYDGEFAKFDINEEIPLIFTRRMGGMGLLITNCKMYYKLARSKKFRDQLKEGQDGVIALKDINEVDVKLHRAVCELHLNGQVIGGVEVEESYEGTILKDFFTGLISHKEKLAA